MQPHIDAVKDMIVQVQNFVSSINRIVSLNMAFCGYRDHSDSKQFEILEFTQSSQVFSDFVKGVKAKGGDDEPEDVLGGLMKACKLDWKHKTRIVYHFGDAPLHGKEYHNSGRDNYPNGDPNGLTIEGVMKELKENNIIYYFGKINSSTDKMIDLFKSFYGDITVFDLSTEDFKELVKIFVESSFRVISDSITVNAKDKIRDKKVKYVTEEPELKNFLKFNTKLLKLETIQKVSEIQLKAKSSKCDIMAMVSKNPFTSGSERNVYHGKIMFIGKDKSPKDYIFKEFKTVGSGENSKTRYLEIISASNIAFSLAAIFNSRKASSKEVNFLKSSLVTLKLSEEKKRYMTVEKKITGEYTRFNTNFALINDLHITLEAFSHFTYVESEFYLLINDLQGVISERGFLLTDPAVQCNDTNRFGKTNLGSEGINLFKKNHICNDVCDKLGIKHVWSK